MFFSLQIGSFSWHASISETKHITKSTEIASYMHEELYYSKHHLIYFQCYLNKAIKGNRVLVEQARTLGFWGAKWTSPFRIYFFMKVLSLSSCLLVPFWRKWYLQRGYIPETTEISHPKNNITGIAVKWSLSCTSLASNHRSKLRTFGMSHGKCCFNSETTAL